MPDILYRYVDRLSYSDEIVIDLYTFPILRRTPKGAWIRDESCRERFCLEGEGKRYAHTTKQFAFDSFKARKRMQSRILHHQKRKVDVVMSMIKDVEDAPKDGALRGFKTVEVVELDLQEFA